MGSAAGAACAGRPSGRIPRSPMNPSTKLALAVLCLSVPSTAQTVGGSSGVTEHVSATSDGALGVGTSTAARLSADGRWVAFHSFAQLLPADTNAFADVYAYDRQTGTLVGVSVDPGGAYGNAGSYGPDISADGRYVAWESGSDNLVPNDFNTWVDVFVRDVVLGTTIRVSSSAATGHAANGASSFATISDDGRYVAFRSSASDLGVPDTNLLGDVYRYDTWTDTMVRVSDGPFGEADGNSYRPRISGDGSRVAWESYATNLVAGDVNGFKDVFVADVGGLPQLVSRTPAGQPANSSSDLPAPSFDGRFVAFNSWATDILPVSAALNVFRYDTLTGQMELVSQSSAGLAGDDHSHAASISADGRYVGFESEATNLAPLAGPTWNAYLRDVDLGLTWTVGRPSGAAGVPDDVTGGPSLSADAATVAFVSRATTIVPGVGTPLQYEVFVRELHPDPFAYCTSATTPSGCQPSVSTSGWPSATAGGGFTIQATDVPNRKTGLLFYGLAGPAALPFQGATLCVAPPLLRSFVQPSGGSPPAVDDCSGSYAVDLNAFAAGGLGGNPHASLTLVGQIVHAQFWGREPAAPSGVFLSDALEYRVGP